MMCRFVLIISLCLLHQFKRFLTFFVFLDCDHQVMNLGFLVDGSAAVELSGKGNFNKSLVFVSKLIGSFDVSKNATRPGLVVFSEDPHLVFNFSLYETLSDVMASTQMASFPGRGRKTGKALHLFVAICSENRRLKISQLRIITLSSFQMVHLTTSLKRLRGYFGNRTSRFSALGLVITMM